MGFEFSLAQLTILSTTPSEITQIAAELGYDYVSLRQIYMGVDNEIRVELYENPQELKKVKEIMRDTGIRLLDTELCRVIPDLDVRDYEPAMQITQELGGKHMLSSIWTDDMPYNIQKFGEICELAKKYGLTVDLEYVPVAGVKDLQTALHVLDEVNMDNAGLMVDTHHFQRARDKVEELEKVPVEKFHFIHLCDAIAKIPKEKEELTRIMREDRKYVGEGGIQIGRILNAIPAVPYSIELPNVLASSKMGYKQHAKRCLETSKAYCEKYVTPRK